MVFSNKKLDSTGKSLSEALLIAEHGENILCTKIVLNVRNNFCAQHISGSFVQRQKRIAIYHVKNFVKDSQ